MKPEKRERILKAAIKVFARDGFFNAKVEEIAKMANVATGTTYLYFDNKDDILISIFEEEMAPIIEEMKNELKRCVSAREKIVAFVTHYLLMVEKNPDMTQLLEVELRQSSRFIHGYSGTKFKEYLNIIADAFLEGQQNGEFRPDVHPSIFKQILFGATDQIAVNWTLSKSKKIGLRQAAEQITKVVLEGIKK
jgi:TetR/AcrR family transcriptional regulator, fatty acid metabolism regulator protein